MWRVFVLAAVVSSGEKIESELAEFQLADGLKIELFASDPSIAKPIQMNFDARGRLWLATSESYPQLEPGAEPRDKIYVLEDTNGDGRADKSTVFAEGLHIPTGIEIGPDGAWVANSTELLYLRDRDGDAKADSREIVLSGFGTEDTHHLIHTFRWGPGGHLFFAQAVYIHSHVETPWGVKRLNGGGFWKFDPRFGKLDIFVTGMTNSWGIAFDAYGQAFGVDNDQYSVNHFLPGAHLIRTPDETHIYPSLVEGKPKYCGAEFVTSPNFPDEWQGDFLTCDFRAHRLCRYRITENGAGYDAQEQAELLSTSNVAFRPVDLKFGPDGALYVCDWYNPIINHGEVDFRDPRRDKTHGRIWRITCSKRPLWKSASLSTASVRELLYLQKSRSGFERHFARRSLLAQPHSAETVSELEAWLGEQTDELTLLHGLWCCQTLGHVHDDLLERLLSATDPHIRAASVRVLSDWQGAIPMASAHLKQMVRDAHPRVRAESIRALADIDDPEAMAWALEAMDLDMDPVIEYALRLNARETASKWLPALKEGKLSPDPAERWIFALLAVDRPEAVGPLLEYWREGKVADEGVVLEFVGRHGDPKSLRMLLDRALNETTPLDLRSRLLNSLGIASRLRQAIPEGEIEGAIRALLDSEHAALREHGVRLAGMWKVKASRGRLAELTKSSKSESEQELAIESLRTLGGAESIEILGDLLQSDIDERRSAACIRALVNLDPGVALTYAMPTLTGEKDGLDASLVVGAFLSSREGPGVLAKGIASVTLSPEVAEAGLKAIHGSGQPLPGLEAAIRKAGGLPAAERKVTPEQLARLAADAAKFGDPNRGKAVYERKELACAQCHAIKGSGGRVGPDMTSIGASAPMDYLIESLIVPGAKVKEGFHSVVIVTDEGKVYSGIPEQSLESEIILRTADDKTVSIAKSSIDESQTGGSLMPTDAVDRLSPGELLDLARYLSELGKPGPFGPSEEQIARKWRLLGPLTAEEGETATTQALAGAFDSRNWRDSLTTNDGWVYLREFALGKSKPVMLATTRIEVKEAGKIRLTLEPGPKGTYWLDGNPLNEGSVRGEESFFDVELAAGDHVLVVQIDLSKVPQKLKLRAYSTDGKSEVHLER